MKPLRPGSPMEPSEAMRKSVVVTGTTRATPPYSDISRVCRLS